MGGYGCIFAFIALLVWIAAQAISALTVGHDISEVGYYWVFGISLALTILLVNWRRNKSAKEKLDVQEGWLGDVARQRADEKRKREDTYARGLRDKRREAENVDTIVMGALKEVGLAYWGSVDKSWEVRRFNAGSPNVSWEVHDNADYYWSVWLTRSDSEVWRFGVTARGDTLYTSNTSAAELKRVLRVAVERGPAFKS